MSTSKKLTKNVKNSQDSVSSRRSLKNSNENVDSNLNSQTLMTVQRKNKSPQKEDPELAKLEKEEIEKQNELLKKIKESEEKLKFEQEQRKNLIEIKKKEIEKKEKTIKQMTETNQKLQNELEVLQVEVQEKLDKIEIKEKNEIFENEKQKREEPLKQLLKVKEKELSNSLQEIERYKKEKENLQKILEQKVDIVQINSLNDQIKMAQEKVDDLEREKTYLNKVREEHEGCEKEQEKLLAQIKELKNELNELKEHNKTKMKNQKDNINLYNNSRMYYNNINNSNSKLSPEEIREKKEHQIKNSLDEFWSKNKDKLLEANNQNENDVESNLLNNSNNGKSFDYGNNARSNSPKIINYKNKKKIAENIINKNLDIENMSELPKIPLFNQKEKKILLNVLPEKEIKKFEKRYECIDKEKTNLQRKFALETKQLNKENKDLESKFEYSSLQLKENEQKNKVLSNQIALQQKEVDKLQEKLNNMLKNLEVQKNKIKEKDAENKNLIKQLQELQSKYEKAPVEEEQNNEGDNGEGNEGENGDN